METRMVKAEVIKETTKARLCAFNVKVNGFTHSFERWVPKSISKVEGDFIEIPEWLAEKIVEDFVLFTKKKLDLTFVDKIKLI